MVRLHWLSVMAEPHPREIFGRLLESDQTAQESAERRQQYLEYLLLDEHWRQAGFKSINAFAAAIKDERSRRTIEERRQAELALRKAGASQPAIAKGLGVDQATVSRDLAAMQPALNEGSDKHVANGHVMHDALPTITLYTHTGEAVEYPEPKGKPTFNLTQGPGISWAKWSWNPVTGCLHGCTYCYAREIATNERTARAFPVGFTPLFHRERLDAPRNTFIPDEHRDDPAFKRVFVCSMADLYGRWVPDEWIDQVHASMLASPEWEYLLLTKFPGRYPTLQLPPNAWVGTSVDEQKRVHLAEDAFRRIEGVKVKWLSLEPLREPLEFSDFSMFNWVVIGAQTATHQPDGETVPAFAPPFEWVARIYLQAKAAGCEVHIKPNITDGPPGLQWPNEYPV